MERGEERKRMPASQYVHTHTTYCTLVQHERIISSMFTDHRCHLVVNCSISVAQKKNPKQSEPLYFTELYFSFFLYFDRSVGLNNLYSLYKRSTTVVTSEMHCSHSLHATSRRCWDDFGHREYTQ